MTFQLTIKMFGDKQVNRRIMGVRERALNMRPVLSVILKEVYASEKALFDTEGSSGASGSWAPLKESTVRKKANRKTGPGDPRILHDTLAMRMSLTAPNQKGSRWSLLRNQMFIGTDFDYAQFHYDGTKWMPARPPVGFTEEEKIEWVRMMQEYVMGYGRWGL